MPTRILKKRERASQRAWQSPHPFTTRERLKLRVLGTRKRNHPADGPFDHTNNAGFVPEAEGDYCDALRNKKAKVHLLAHEAGLGGMLPYAASRLRRLARAAAALKIDATDYSRSYTARDYVSYYTQRISSAGVYNGARGILKSIAYKHYKRRNPA